MCTSSVRVSRAVDEAFIARQPLPPASIRRESPRLKTAKGIVLSPVTCYVRARSRRWREADWVLVQSSSRSSRNLSVQFSLSPDPFASPAPYRSLAQAGMSNPPQPPTQQMTALQQQQQLRLMQQRAAVRPSSLLSSHSCPGSPSLLTRFVSSSPVHLAGQCITPTGTVQPDDARRRRQPGGRQRRSFQPRRCRAHPTGGASLVGSVGQDDPARKGRQAGARTGRSGPSSPFGGTLSSELRSDL